MGYQWRDWRGEGRGGGGEIGRRGWGGGGECEGGGRGGRRDGELERRKL